VAQRGVWRRLALHSRPRRALALLLALATASGTAFAATELFGPPVHPGPVVLGGPKSGSVVLAPLRVADPAGGLPWGVRIYTPRRSARGTGSPLTCVQVGRVLDGQLGVIGADGAFHNDGLFHVLPIEPLSKCIHARTVALFPGYVPASGYTGAGSCRADSASTTATKVRPDNVAAGSSACARAAVRLVVYGVATSETRTVRVSTSSGVVSEHLVAADRGGFVFVLPGTDASGDHAHLRVSFSS
jgi:hypothetical protein